MSEQFKRDGKRHLFVPSGFIEQSKPDASLNAAIQKASLDMAKRIDAFLEMALKLVLPEEIIKLVGENPVGPQNQMLFDQLGITMNKENDRHTLGKMKVTVFIRARNYKESNFTIATLDIITTGNQMQFTSKVNRLATERQYAFTHPAIRHYLRELGKKGVAEAKRLFEEKASKLKVVLVEQEGLSQ